MRPNHINRTVNVEALASITESFKQEEEVKEPDTYPSARHSLSISDPSGEDPLIAYQNSLAPMLPEAEYDIDLLMNGLPDQFIQDGVSLGTVAP